MEAKTVQVAFAGNPNSGKTTLFNALTGARQHVGNYPGVTVEKKYGTCQVNGRKIEIVDLPGTYSLTAVSEEEAVARNAILDGQFKVVVNIVDCSNLERNLYLTVQLLELGVPVILALNMVDIADRRGLAVNTDKLAALLRVPVIPTVGHKQIGLEELKRAILAYQSAGQPLHIDYGPDIEQAIAELEKVLDMPGPRRWFAIKILENDPALVRRLRQTLEADHPLWSKLDHVRQKLIAIYRDTPEILIADRRYGFISGIWQEVAKTGVETRHNFSDQIDSVLIHPVIGLPIFLILMYLVFYAVFTLADAPTRWLESGFSLLGTFLNGFWPAGSDSPIRSLLVDGIVGGVGGVIVFLPNIMLLFLAIALLEDSGYMARAAFIMDRFMHRIGLHGKSFIPMLIGFGCSVPAIMATRILENKRDRITTIMIIPLMSCGARLTIYSLVIPAFFPSHWQAPVLWMIYVFGIVLAAVLAKVLRVFVLKGEGEGLVMELPPYRMPTLRSALIHMALRGRMYLQKAGTVILAFSVILWALTTYPRAPRQITAKIADPAQRKSVELQYAAIGRLGRAVEPGIRPLGFDWRIGTALAAALPAKEMFVAQMGIVLSVGEHTDHREPVLRDQLRRAYSPLTGLCVLIFCLVSAPCLTTIAVTRRETNSWFWAAAQFFGLTALGYLLTLIVFQTGSRFF